jgi:DNA replication protein DnaC
MNQITVSRLRDMRLPTMASKLQEMLATPSLQGLPWPDAIDILVDSEHNGRADKRLSQMLKTARLKYPQACLEDLGYSEARGITKDIVRPFKDGTYIKNTHNIVICGPTGTGKSYLACALANHACRNGVKTRFARIGPFLDELEAAKALGKLASAMTKLLKLKVLILDDLGADMLSVEHRKLLLEVVEEFYMTRSLIITSQVPVAKWAGVIGEPGIAEAICDRLFHYCHGINLKGESLRKKAQK